MQIADAEAQLPNWLFGRLQSSLRAEWISQ